MVSGGGEVALGTARLGPAVFRGGTRRFDGGAGFSLGCEL